MSTVKQFQTLQELYGQIKNDSTIESSKKKEFLDLLNLQNPSKLHFLNGVKFFPLIKEINLKSFYCGNEGVNMIRRENGNFETYVLPHLPEVYTLSDEYKECFMTGYKKEVSLITSSANHCPTLFSLNDALAVLAERIIFTKENPHSPWYLIFDTSGKDNLIYFENTINVLRPGNKRCDTLIARYITAEEKSGWQIDLVLPAGD